MPTLSMLRSGALLSSVVHATMQTTCPQWFQGWHGDDLILDDVAGTRGAVTFFKDGVTAAFYDVHSEHHRDGVIDNQSAFYEGIPAAHSVIMEQFTLQYLMDEWDGRLISLVTASFWNIGEQLT